MLRPGASRDLGLWLEDPVRDKVNEQCSLRTACSVYVIAHEVVSVSTTGAKQVVGTLAGAVALILSLGWASPVSASLPGTNGRFVFSGLMDLQADSASMIGTTGHLARRMQVVYHTANEEQYVSSPKWSPSGKWIAYVQEFFGALRVVRADGSQTKTLFRGRDVNSPAWSPNGSHIAFCWRDDIYTVRRDGTHVTRLTWSPRRGEYDLDWSSRHLLAFDTEGGQIYSMRWDGTGLRQLTSGPGPNAAPSWAPRGHRLAYEHDNQIWTMRADGSHPASLGITGHSPVWSPDGSHIAYLRGVRGAIHLVAPSGTGDITLGTPRGASFLEDLDWQRR